MIRFLTECLCVCVQLVRRVSMVWIVNRSVCVWTGVSVIMSMVNVPAGLAGSVHTVTKVSFCSILSSLLSSWAATVPLRLLCGKDVWWLANFFTCEIDKALSNKEDFYLAHLCKTQHDYILFFYEPFCPSFPMCNVCCGLVCSVSCWIVWSELFSDVCVSQ